MKAFVTGATGFVGGHLAEVLKARGDTVIALARRPDAARALVERGILAVSGSLEDAGALRDALAGADVVYHVAGLVAARNAAEFHAVNEAGTVRLLAAAREVCPGTRFVYVSSQAAVGPSPVGTSLDEAAECRPVTAYGRSKLAGERAVMAGPLAWSVVRPPSVYGPRDREFLKLFRVARWGLAPVFGTGAQELSLIHVEDLVRAIAVAGTHPAAERHLFHAAHAEVVLSRDVARAAGRALGGDPIVLPVPGLLATPVVAAIGWAAAAAGRPSVLNADKMAEFLAPSWRLDVTKAHRLLAWRAETALAEGFARTVSWYRAHGWL